MSPLFFIHKEKKKGYFEFYLVSEIIKIKDIINIVKEKETFIKYITQKSSEDDFSNTCIVLEKGRKLTKTKLEEYRKVLQ